MSLTASRSQRTHLCVGTGLFLSEASSGHLYQEVVHYSALITPLPESLVCEYILEKEELTPGKGFPILSALTSLIWLTRPGFPVLLV